MTTNAVRLYCGLTLIIATQLTLPAYPRTETHAGWVKCPGNPVLGGTLSTCFDISVLRVGDTYRM